MIRKDVTPEIIKSLFVYDKEDGSIRWSETRMTGRHKNVVAARAGAIAGCIGFYGYRQISVFGFLFRANRIAWAHAFGVWPAGVVDHIDGDRSNDRLLNLRDVSQRTNSHNQRASGKKTSTGLLGASFQKCSGKFTAQIVCDGTRVHIGTFNTAEKAHAAYMARKAELHAGYVK